MILLQGTQYANKGDVLMLHAVLRHMRARRILLHHTARRDARRQGIRPTGAYVPNPTFFQRRTGTQGPSSVRAVIDCCGYSCTDAWGPQKTRTMAEDARKWRERGVQVILLPQTFGPFTNGILRDAMRDLLNHTTLVFARDSRSLNHLHSLEGRMDHVHLAPDYTVDVLGTRPAKPLPPRTVLLIPNARMVDAGPKDQAARYGDFLRICAQIVREAGCTPVTLIHDDGDLELARVLQQHENVACIQENNALVLKSIIGSAYAVISSRFHGLINAFSQGVPAAGTAWCHKFPALLADYGCDDLLLSPLMDKATLRQRLAIILQDESRVVLHQQLFVRATVHRSQTEKMWMQVQEALDAI